MPQPVSNCYYLTSGATDFLASDAIGKLTLAMTKAKLAVPFVVLDCFDQSISRSGRLLLATDDLFELLTADGRLLSQTANRGGHFVADFAEGPVKQALADLSPLRSLLAIGSGQMRRANLALTDGEQRIRCRACLHILTAMGGEAAVLVTLQGLVGHDKALTALRRHVEDCGGTPLNSGAFCAHLFPGQVAYTGKAEGIIGSDDTAFNAATDIISACITVARASEAGIIADHDTEFLHDYRVALRRIRSVLSLFKGVYDEDQTAALKTGFSELMVPTGRFRDLDVYLLARQQYYESLPKILHGGLDTMFSMFTDERKAEKARLAQHLRSEGYTQAISDLAGLFAERVNLQPGPIADLGAIDCACSRIWKRYRKICKLAGGIGPETQDAEVHVLRMHCKKLRYLMEFVSPLFPKQEFVSLIKPLKRLQDNLGLVNDCSVQQVSLHDFLQKTCKWPDGVGLDVAQSVGALIAVLHRRQLEERVKIVGSLSQFSNLRTKATFRDLFHDRRGRKRRSSPAAPKKAASARRLVP